VLDDEGEDIVATVYDSGGKITTKETLTVQRAAKVRVQGGA
jgi:hypothetical protein